MIQLFPLIGIGEVEPGCALAQILADALEAGGIHPELCDVLVVAQKIVSKAEGRFVDLRNVEAGNRAKEIAAIVNKDPRFVELILAESTDVVRAAPNVLITRHRAGYVMANAGIDHSNIGSGDSERVLLLPEDADRSAAHLRHDLGNRWPMPPAVIISDSFGRPWRMGVVNVAIGVSGLPALIDRRGDTDRNGRRLEVTQVAFADLIASAAGIEMGEGAEGVPSVLVRGLNWTAPETTARALIRPVEEDLFR